MDLPPERPQPEPGRTFGRFVILGPLGEGGMGLVWSAYDPRLDRRVALKLLRADTGGAHRAEARARLVREAQAMARLAHPNVLTVHDVGTVGDEVFITMELVEGCSLRAWLAERPRSPRDVVAAFLEAGRGLAAAHDAGILHRDFKPDNVLVGADGRVRVLDFGLARTLEPAEAATQAAQAAAHAPPAVRPDDVLDSTPGLAASLTRTGALMGTPLYLSPEAAGGGRVDARSDQFSFCSALYEALYGQPPFPGTNPVEVVARILEGRPAPPTTTQVSARLRRIVLRGLDPDPARRYPDLHALLADLAYDPAVRRRRVAAAAAALALTALAGVAVYRADVRQRRLCAGAPARLAGVWDGARGAALAAAFAATGDPVAAASVEPVRRRLDAYAAAWAAMYTDACEATHRRGEQSEALLDLRMQCLEQRRLELAALADLLVDGDPAVARRAVEAAHGLSPIAHCAEAAVLAATEALPAEPAERAAVLALREPLARAKASYDAGRYGEGLEVAVTAAAAADALGWAPARAEAHYLAGLLQERAGLLQQAEESLYTGLYAAEAGRHDRVAAQAWTRLVWQVGVLGARPEEARRLVGHAEATLARLGADDVVAGDLMNHRGVLAAQAGDAGRALELFGAALERRERALGPEHPAVASTLSNLALVLEDEGRLEEAADLARRALDLRRAALGPTHPRVADSLLNLGGLLWNMGRAEEAVALVEEAHAVAAGSLGPQHPMVGTVLNNLASHLLDVGRPDEARTAAERGLAVLEAAYGSDHPEVAKVRYNLACSLRAAGEHRRALEQCRAALAIWEGAGADPGDLADAEICIGTRLLALGRPEEAAPHLARALESLRAGGAGHGRARQDLAEAMWRLGRDREHALALAEEAVAELERDLRPGSRQTAAEAAAWLAARRVELDRL